MTFSKTSIKEIANRVVTSSVEDKFLVALKAALPKSRIIPGRNIRLVGSGFNLDKVKALMAAQKFTPQGEDLFPMEEGEKLMYFIECGEVLGVFTVEPDGAFEFEFSGY